MEKTKKSTSNKKEKKNEQKKKDKKDKKKQKKELTVTRNVLKAMHLKCHRDALSEMHKSDSKRYRKLIRVCRAFRTRLTAQTLGNRVFFSSSGNPSQFHAASQYESCWIRASADDSAAHYNRPNEKLATPLSFYYWRTKEGETDIGDDTQYHPFIEYVGRKDVDFRMLVLHNGGDDAKTPQEQLEAIGEARRTARKLLKFRFRKTSSKKKEKKRKREKKDKKKKKIVSSKRQRYQLYETYYDEEEDYDNDEEEDDYDDDDESDEDDASYAPSDDDSDDEGGDPSSDEEEEEEDEEEDDSHEIDEELTLDDESVSSSSSEEEEEEASTTY